MPKGINPRHTRSCSLRSGGRRCTCTPTYQAQVWDPRTRRRVSTTKPTEQEAIDWRAEKRLEIRRGTFRPGRQVTIRVALEELITDMRAGIVRNRSGDTYKPGTIRGYEQAARDVVAPAFGSARLAELRRSDVQRLVSRLMTDGKDASTIRNALMPLRVLYRRAIALDEIATSPLIGVELPAVRGRRMRIAPPEEAARLLEALPAEDRAVWATAMYAGLRLGELQALDLADVDLASGVIRVEWTWDRPTGEKLVPKSEAGRRRVPIPAILRDPLLEHRMSLEWTEGLIFGRSATDAFRQDTLRRRATRAWDATNEREQKAAAREEREPRLLESLTPHDCRHTYASLMIAAGVNAKALSTYMGHATISITQDRYGHLFPGNEEEAAGLLDAYLERANTAARKAAVSGG